MNDGIRHVSTVKYRHVDFPGQMTGAKTYFTV